MNGGYQSSGYDFRFNATRITWAVRWLILVNIAAFAAQLALRPLEALVGNPGLVLHFLAFQPSGLYYGQFWQLFTYQFLHGGLMHLTMNMLWLFFFGPEVERLLGSRQFLYFYVLCGALGVLATLLALALYGEYAIVLGASGSVMGVLVAFAMIDPQRQMFLFPIPVPITALWMVILVAAMNILSGLSGEVSSSVFTHLGGMAAGYGLMKAIPIYHQWKRDRIRARMGDSSGEHPGDDKIREEIDNIFKFKDRR